MHLLYGTLLFALTALALPQNPDDPAQNPAQALLLTEVATQLASIESQTLQDTGALEALAKSNIVGQDQQLAAENAALMTKLGEVHQLAQAETAALTEAKNLAINNAGATNTAGVTDQPPSGVAEQCALLQSQSSLYEQVQDQASVFAASGGGPALFSASSNLLQQRFGCQGSSSEICASVANLVVQLQGISNQIVQVTRSDVSTADNGRHQIITVGLSNVANTIVDGATAVQKSFAGLKTSLQCSAE